MRAEIVMPDLGYEVDEGTISSWLVSVGDDLVVGQTVVEVEADKTTLAVEALHPGTLVEIVYDVGDVVPVGQVMAYIEVAG